MKYFLLTAAVAISITTRAQIIQTFAGDGTPGFSGEGGPAINARFNRPVGVVADRWGNIYLASDDNDVIQKIDTDGILWRFAGDGTSGYSGDGGPATAARLSLSGRPGMAADSFGNIYISDNNVVRKIDAMGIITTVAGNGSTGSSGDGGPATAAQLLNPTGICIDKSGNLYINDEVGQEVRKVDAAGIISTIAGHGSFYMDGMPATSVRLGGGIGIAVDDLGNIYFGDSDPFNYDRIRKINTAGIITTVAGGGTSSTPCNGCPATSMKLSTPWGVAVDRDGNVFVSDASYEVIHKITPDGLIYHVAGTSDFGFSGDGGPATAAKLNGPGMLCLDKKGDLLFADISNYRFRKVMLSTARANTLEKPQQLLQVFPNPHTGDHFTVKLSGAVPEEGTVSISNVLGQIIFTDKLTTNQPKDIHLQLANGVYTITVQTATSNTTSLWVSK